MSFDGQSAVELFLFQTGSGVLSFSILAKPETGLTLPEAKSINYRMSQYYFDKSGFLAKPRHPRAPAPPFPEETDNTLIDRLGKPGGWFRLTELAVYLKCRKDKQLDQSIPSSMSWIELYVEMLSAASVRIREGILKLLICHVLGLLRFSRK